MHAPSSLTSLEYISDCSVLSVQLLLEVLLPKVLAPFQEARTAAQEPMWQLLRVYSNALAPLVLPPLLLALCGATVRCAASSYINTHFARHLIHIYVTALTPLVPVAGLI